MVTIMAFGFGKKQSAQQSAASEPTTVVSPSGDVVSLEKGKTLNLTKRDSNAPIVVANRWTAKRKDYDLKAAVRCRDGRLIYVGAANADEVIRTPEGAVVHSGDAVKAGEVETLTIAWHPDIASIAVSSYSALENGPGSFKQNGVSVEIRNGAQVVSMAASETSASSNRYTLCFGEILFGNDGQLSVSNLEMYSRPGGENRVGYQHDKVVMDIGPEGQKK